MAVTGARRSRIAAACAALTLLAVTGCTGSSTAEPQPAATSSAPDPSPSTAAGSTPSESTPTGPTGAPSPGSMVTPDVTAGPLSQASFPTPRQLGAGWTYSVDPGDAEEGYAGNGTPVVERYVEEIAQTAVPFGCERTRKMPAPAYALEVDYTYRGAKAIAVRGKFRDRAAAKAFFVGRAGNLRDCLGHTASAGIGPLVGRLTRPARNAVASDRTPESDPWRELAVLDGSTVALLAVQGTDHLTDTQTRRLVTLLRH